MRIKVCTSGLVVSSSCRQRSSRTLIVQWLGCTAAALACGLTAVQQCPAACVPPPAGLASWWPGAGSAVAVATVSNGVVVKVTITNAGIGYTNTPSILIAPPPANALWPVTSQALALRFTGLAPYDNYQAESTLALGATWSNAGTPFTPTSTMSTQYVDGTDEVGFYRVKYVP